jgi:hypothetical protein|tara:strand:- start:20497 stop:20652 length:156 start_codon:yes stop_codon:yes gene_type:complete
MIHFLFGVATGWMFARAPPTKHDLDKAVDSISSFLQLDLQTKTNTEVGTKK